MCPSPPWFHHPERRLLAGFLGLLWLVLAGGCATTTAPHAPDAFEEVSTAPEPEAQTIDVSMPADARVTVGDGLRHVLKRSGYSLCQTAHAVIELYALPLPAAHLHLGPMTLRDALLTLAGPAWELHADDRARQICFERPGDSVAIEPMPEPAAADAVQTFPLMPSIPGGQP